MPEFQCLHGFGFKSAGACPLVSNAIGYPTAFTPKLRKPSIGDFEDVFAMTWRTAAGKDVSLPS